MINLRILGIAVLVALLGIVTISLQATSALETIFLDADEAAMAENTTNMSMANTNQTESQNMTGSMMDNSTS